MSLRTFVRSCLILIVIVFCLGNSQWALAIDQSLPAYITYAVEDTLYLEMVGSHQLKTGDTGVIKRRGREVAYVRVTEPGPRYIYCQIISQVKDVTFQSGESVVFETRIQPNFKGTSVQSSKWKELDKSVLGGGLDQAATGQVSTPTHPLTFENGDVVPFTPLLAETPAPPPPAPTPSPEPAAPTAAMPATSTETPKTSTLKSGTSEKEFVPLLSPVSMPAMTKTAKSRDRNLFHGRLRMREVYQSVPSLSMHTSQSKIDSDGSIERLYAGPWSAVWNANMTYRDGNDFASASDFRHPRAHVYTAMLSRKMEDGGSWRLGRFLPSELPGLGFLDGSLLEHVVSPRWRLGGLAAFRPDRIDLNIGTKEPLAAAYATTEQGTHGELYYTGTLGLLQSIYRGKLDELALLYDHRMDLGPKLNLFATSQLDMNTGAAQVHSGPRLTRMDFYGNSPVLPYLSLRAGLSHYERPDIAAERDLSGGSLTGFDDGFWRYFVGSNQRLPWQLSTDEELSYIDSSVQSSDKLWRFSISRTGLPFLPDSQVTLAVYNVTTSQGQGIAYQGTASTPFWNNKVYFYLASSAQYSSVDTTSKKFNINDASVRVNWRVNRAWNLDAGVSQTYQSNITSTISDASLSYRW